MYNRSETYVSGSSEIQTLCRMTQVLLKLRLTTMDRQTDHWSLFSSRQMCRYITN